MPTLCIVGLGYIGLPTAAMFSSHGLEVVGYDVNTSVVEALNKGEILIEEPGLEEVVKAAVESGKLTASTTPPVAEAYIIAVPTPIADDHTADMRAVRAATRSLIPVIRKGCLVVLESTSPPGTTMNLVKPILEESGLKAGVDFHLAFSPERVLPGLILQELVNNDRVVGGIDEASAIKAQDLYKTFVKGTITRTDPTTAEMVKVMENTFRDVNIALANEFALICEKLGINVWEAIAMANKHPRVNVLKPGPGVGGHCIAVDPWFLVEAAPEEAKLINQARHINEGMPDHVMNLVAAGLGAGDAASKTVACFGLTFKPDIDDTRESPALHIAQRLVAAGYQVKTHDPHVAGTPVEGAIHAATAAEALDGADLLLLLVDHKEFRSLSPEVASVVRGKAVVDTRNLLDKAAWIAAGFTVRTIGAA